MFNIVVLLFAASHPDFSPTRFAMRCALLAFGGRRTTPAQLEKEVKEKEEIHDQLNCWRLTNDKAKAKSIENAQGQTRAWKRLRKMPDEQLVCWRETNDKEETKPIEDGRCFNKE